MQLKKFTCLFSFLLLFPAVANTSEILKKEALPMKIDYLGNHPEWAPIIAQWTYDSWHQYDSTLTVEKSLASIKTRLNTDKIPLTLVMIENDKPIATANLKTSVPVLNVPANKIWLGSFYVKPEYQHKGIGSKLMQAIFQEAIKHGKQELYLFTSDPQIVPWYQKQGWQVVDKLPFQGHMVTLMRWKARND